jgi:hypothetical protein
MAQNVGLRRTSDWNRRGSLPLVPSPEAYVFGISYGHRFGLADIMSFGICAVVAFCGTHFATAAGTVA